MEASIQRKIKIRSSYNLSGINFTPGQISVEIKKYIPKFCINYKSDFRQEIVDSWPSSINDSDAEKIGGGLRI